MIDFPASPTDGQLFSASNGVLYKYSAAYSSWLAQNPAPPFGGTGDFYASYTGGTYGPPVTPAVFVFGTVTSGNSGSWYNAGTGRYTPPAGRYSITACINWLWASGTPTGQIQLLKNGSVIKQELATLSSTVNWNTTVINATVDANGADYFEITVASLTTSGGTQITAGNNWFGAFPLTGMQGPTGPAGVTQTVFFETGAVATGTTVIPFDDTIPQQTEGDQYMSLSITPQSATSKLVIEIVVNATSSVVGDVVAALFQDATANALAASWAYCVVATQRVNISFRHVMTSSTTSATTFRVRVGPATAGTVTFNGTSTFRNFGGVLASSIVIREVP